MSLVASIETNQLSQEMVQLPSVQLIGAQKAGTSAIADWLFEEGGFHRPKVFDDEPDYYSKECHYFDLDWRYGQGVEFYAKRFEHCGERSLDASPDTLPFAGRVRSTYEKGGGNQAGTLKIIVILREPVSRELSLYNHLAFDCRYLPDAERNEWHTQVLRENGIIMSFDEFVRDKSIPALGQENGPGRSTRHGLYAKHLSKWFEVFDRKQILVLSYDELQHNPGKLQERIQSFLGFEIPGQLKRSNSNDSPHKVQLPSREAKAMLLKVFAPFNEKLYQILEASPGPPMEQQPFPEFQGP